VLLRKLQKGDEEPFLRALALAGSEPFVHYYRPDLSFAAYVQVLADAEHGGGLPERHVPSTLLFGFVDGEIVGRLMLRHSLNDFLFRVGGNIGYVVVPPHRGHGYAALMLKQGLDLARSMGLPKVLLTCDPDNVASRRVIEKCGGEFEDTYVGPEAPAGKRRYWIALPRP
jgi:predicted acetyltransferase